jgi:endo-1,4-beta-D-glucanase Y
MREWFRPDEPLRSLTTSAPPYFPIAEPHESPYCTLPSTANPDDAVDAYELWKAELLTEEGAAGHLRVVRPDTPDGLPNSTVSEGISYGMILAAYLDDQDTFDQLWLYSQAFANDHGLMNWYIDPTGTIECPGEEDECGAATDADEDIAWALLIADRQWGGGAEREPGSDYIDLAIAQIDRVLRWEIEFNTNVVRPGDRWGGSATTNPSYFAPAYYRVFAAVTGDDQWLEVAEVSYDLLEASLNAENGNQDNGLVPAWMNAAGTPVKAWDDEVSADGSVIEAPLHHQYDSERMPLRIVQD